MIGTRIAHYDIVEKLGSGGMGDVYRARDTKLDRDVALKILPEEFAQSAQRARRFEQEAKAVAALSHPNVLAIYDFGSDGDQWFAAMELLEGDTLAGMLADGPLPPRKAVQIGVQIANGLAAAHARGVIHRDLKPANIFVSRDGRPKILDFGLARVEDSTNDDLSQSPTVQTDPGTVMGTVGYMSPEQARGAELCTRSDIFSLGAVLYEMLTGDRAFAGDSAADIIGSILRDDPPLLREKDASIPEGLDRVVHHCLEKKPEERFQSANDLAFALANATSASSGELPPMYEKPAPRSWGSRYGAWTAIAIVGWMAALLFFLLPRFDSVDVGEPVRLTPMTYSGRDSAPTASPDGSMIAFTSDRDGESRIWVKRVGGGGEVPITEGSDHLARFSPDGSQILFLRRDGRSNVLYRAPVLGGAPRRITNDVLEADWSPDGSEVAFVRMQPGEGENDVQLGIANVQSGAERIIASTKNRSWYSARWSPRGDFIAVAETGLTGTVSVQSYVNLINPATGEIERVTLTDWVGAYTALEWTPSGRTFVIGQAREVLALVAGAPALVMEFDVDSRKRRPLFWATMRVPTAGWGFSTLTIAGEHAIIIGEEVVSAELHEVSMHAQDGITQETIVTSGLGRDRQPAYSPDGSHVIFSSNRSDNIDIWSVELASGKLTQLTDDPAGDWDPAYSADGEHIIWSSDRGGNMEIWMARTDGSGTRQVTSDGVDAENATMTPDGEWLVYSSANDKHLGVWKIRTNGRDATHLMQGVTVLPEVSPDGRYALFAEIHNLNTLVKVIDVNTSEVVPFEIELENNSRAGNLVAGRARWAPDGKGIVFVGFDEPGNACAFIQDFVPGENTSASRRMLVGGTNRFSVESLGVAPDGDRLTVSVVLGKRSLMVAEGVVLDGWE